MKRLAITTFSITFALSTLPATAAQQQLVPPPPPIIITPNQQAQYGVIQQGYVSKYAPSLPVLSDDTVKLNPKEKQAVTLADQWKNKPDMPFMAEDGSIQFIYGSTLPSVVCAPLYACDVALQPGEVVLQVLLGDSSRWKVCPGISGKGENTVSHLVIKPSDVGLSTNLVIHTDRRSYNIQLVSKKDQWVPFVSFSYPEDTQAQWAAYREQQQQRLSAKITTNVNATAPDLNFNYKIRGNSTPWKPVRVYSSSGKTYIQFPSTIKYDKIPALVILDRNQKQVVNYRIANNKYVVDQIIDKAALIRGVGKNQERIEILKEGS